MISLQKITAAGCAVLVAASAVVTAFASDYNSYYALTDDAALFAESEAAGLKAKMEEAGKKTGWQVIIHTDNYGADSDSMSSHYENYYYSQSYYESNATMLVFDTESDNRVILNFGSANNYFNGSVFDDVKSAMKPYLENGDYIGAAEEYVKQVEYAYSSGKVEDDGASGGKSSNRFLTSLSRWWIYLLIALAVFGLFILINRSRYKNMGKSGTYDLKKNSQLRLLDQQDVIVDRHTTYTTINTGSGSSSGGSSGGGSGHSSGSF